MESLYTAQDYREWIRAQGESSKHGYGYRSRLANAAKCQRSYLSQVLSERAHLTLEQAERLARFWNLSNEQTAYWLSLVARDRAGTPELRSYHQSEMDRLRAQASHLASRFKADKLDDAALLIYYSDPLITQVHMLLTIPAFQTLESLIEVTGQSRMRLETVLSTLGKLGLTKRSGKLWVTTKKVVHVPRDSPAVVMNHQAWRMRAGLNSARRDTKSIHYTALYTLSLQDLERLKQLVLSFMDQTRKIVAPSKEESLVCLILDLFDPSAH